MKHSIRRQITVIFICVLVFILGTLFVVNMGFLERYYFSYKTKDLLDTYKDVDQALQKDTFRDDDVSWSDRHYLWRGACLVFLKEDNEADYGAGRFVKGNGKSEF